MSTDVEKTDVATVAPTNMAVGKSGMELRSFDEVWRFAQCLAKSKLAPRGLEQAEQIVIALQMGFELGLPPMAAIQTIAVINGRPMVFGDGPLAVCRSSGVFDEKAFVETIEKKGNVLTATCTCQRKGGNPVTRIFDLEDAKTADLLTKPGPWKQYPRRMLQMRARAWALRDAFTDVLRGCKIQEEYEGVEGAIDVAFAPPRAATKAARKSDAAADAELARVTAAADAGIAASTAEGERLAAGTPPENQESGRGNPDAGSKPDVNGKATIAQVADIKKLCQACGVTRERLAEMLARVKAAKVGDMSYRHAALLIDKLEKASLKVAVDGVPFATGNE